MYIELKTVDKTMLDQSQLAEMLTAGEEILECYRVMKKVKLNVVGECMKNQGKFIKFTHYPQGDVYDWETHAQYYYHTHRGIEGEHGHFHTFLRYKGMAEDMYPVPYDGDTEWPLGEEAVSHIIAISMDKYGYPIGLFSTNRWVTGETWYKAEHVKKMVELFKIDHAWPNWPVNRWISAMFRLFKPEINALIGHRDQVVEQWSKDHQDKDTFEDRDLEITGYTKISVEKQIEEIQQALD